jgi:hypothetical protein
MKTITRGPISFDYPANWELDIEDDGDSWTVQLQSPATAIFLASLRPEIDDAGELANETLEALRSEYKELDAEPVVVSLGGWPALGADVDFLTLDTPTLCLIRCLNTSVGPVLFLAQVSEIDRADTEPLLRAMLDSVRVTDGDE